MGARFPKTKDAEQFLPLTMGWYKLRVLKVEEKKDKNNDPYWNVEFNVVSMGDKRVWDNFRDGEGWLFKLKMFLEAIDPNLTEMELDAESIYEREVMAHIVPNKVGDKTWERIKQYEPVGSIQETPDKGVDFP